MPSRRFSMLVGVFFFIFFFFTPVCLSPLVSPFFPFSSLLFFLYSFFFLRLFLQQLNSHEWRMGPAYELVSCELSSHILFGVSVVWLLRLSFFCSPLPKLRRSGIRKSSCFYFRFRCNWTIWKFEPISTFFPRVSWFTFAFQEETGGKQETHWTVRQRATKGLCFVGFDLSLERINHLRSSSDKMYVFSRQISLGTKRK